MKFWLTCFVLLFIGTELSQWLVQSIGEGELELSTPLTLLGGLGLALASNGRRQALPDSPVASTEQSQPSASQPPDLSPLPVASESAAAKSISFEIHPPERL